MNIDAYEALRQAVRAGQMTAGQAKQWLEDDARMRKLDGLPPRGPDTGEPLDSMDAWNGAGETVTDTTPRESNAPMTVLGIDGNVVPISEAGNARSRALRRAIERKQSKADIRRERDAAIAEYERTMRILLALLVTNGRLHTSAEVYERAFEAGSRLRIHAVGDRIVAELSEEA